MVKEHDRRLTLTNHLNKQRKSNTDINNKHQQFAATMGRSVCARESLRAGGGSIHLTAQNRQK